jgi:hypothetical protein
MDTEEWRPIPGFDGYEASSHGRIRSLSRMLPSGGRGAARTRKRLWPAAIVSQHRQTNGYMSVHLRCLDGTHVTGMVNRLVFAAFHRPLEVGEEADHDDLVRDHNRPGNLVALTVAQNRARRVPKRGAASHYAKLTEADVLAIRAMTGTHKEVARRFGVSASNIGMIRNGRTWTDLRESCDGVASGQG